MLSLCQEGKEVVCVCVSVYLSNTIYVCVWSGEFGGSGVSPIQLCAIDVHGRL